MPTPEETARRIIDRTARRKALGLIPERYDVPAECLYLADELGGKDCARRGLNVLFRWHFCGHSDEPLGPVVCGRSGCGPKCPGYDPIATG